jgi:hypothetical protein
LFCFCHQPYRTEKKERKRNRFAKKIFVLMKERIKSEAKIVERVILLFLQSLSEAEKKQKIGGKKTCLPI